MFKKFRIKHEGLHRIGIVIGILFIILSPWFVLGILNGFDYELIEVIYAHAIVIEEIYEGGGALFLLLLVYPLSYFVGYFIVSIISWLREGFKK
jgi:hypothetical protein